MKILVCGDRNWIQRMPIRYALYGMPKGTIIINGACRGADKTSSVVARHLGFECREYPADWEKHGRAAGPIRNREMLDKESPDLVIAFHSNIFHSKGTRDMCRCARDAGIPVILITG